MITDPPRFLRSLFQTALGAVGADLCVPPALPLPPRGRTVVVGAGKAAAAMAVAVESHWSGPLSGLVITPNGHALPTHRIEVIEVPSEPSYAASRFAAERILAAARSLNPEDLLLCLWSSGASKLLALAAPGVTLDDKRLVSDMLEHAGASAREVGIVRKHLSAIKGGRLTLAAGGAQVVSLLISDAPGDDPAVIASGPTMPDPSTYDDACAVIARYHVDAPAAVLRMLADAPGETPKPHDPRFARAETRLVGTPQMALEAAAAAAAAVGVTPVILGSAIEGEARDVARMHAGIARQVGFYGQPAPAPLVLLSGGETSVTVGGMGQGGRNTEFLLSLALALEGATHPLHPVYALSADTDGIDGAQTNAGAMLYPDSLKRAAGHDLNARRMLADNDAYSFFAELGDLVTTGPTLTNVNDFRAILVL